MKEWFIEKTDGSVETVVAAKFIVRDGALILLDEGNQAVKVYGILGWHSATDTPNGE